MDDDLIEALADAFAETLVQLDQPYKPVLYETIISVAVVINSYEPTYDMRYFYKRAGYPEPYPIHEMQG